MTELELRLYDTDAKGPGEHYASGLVARINFSF